MVSYVELPPCPVCGRATRARRRTQDYACTKCLYNGTLEEIAAFAQKKKEDLGNRGNMSAEDVRFDNANFSKKP